MFSENLLNWLESNVGLKRKHSDELLATDYSSEAVASDNSNNMKSSYIDLLKPVHQQWHLRNLLIMVKKNIPTQVADTCATNQSIEYLGNFKLLSVIYLYYYMLRIFSFLNPFLGSLPILNILSFTPGFLVELWEILEASIFSKTGHLSHEVKFCKDAKDANFGNCNERICDTRQRRNMKDAGSKWVNVLQKIAGRSTDGNYTNSNDDSLSPDQVNEDAYDLWDVEAMRRGPQGISKDLSCMLHLFCATYAHLLLVLDDIEFYEKQVY